MKPMLLLRFSILALMAALALPTFAAQKESGATSLKDVQPAGTTSKDHKKQQYDFTFDSATHEYTCRSNENEKVNATDFVVGSQVSYQVNGNKGKVKSTSTGKQVSCMIVRVADLPLAR
jgi:hypothetical protein